MLKRLKELRDSREEGFTLVELLVVIVIIGVLAAIALPLFNQQQVRALEASAMSSLRARVVSIQTYLVKNPNAEDTTTNTPAGRPISEASKAVLDAMAFGVAEGPFAPDAATGGKTLRNTGGLAKWDGWSVAVYPTSSIYGQPTANNFAVSYNVTTNKFTTWRGNDSGVLQPAG